MLSDGRRILAVVPARGGSKGVPLKNIHPLLGKPLIAYTGDLLAALKPRVDVAVASTDHDGIAEEAENSGISVPFRRTEELSGDRIGDLEVLCHALTEMEKIDGSQFDIVLMLQPTSPLRTPDMVNQCLDKMEEDSGIEAVWTVNQVDLKYHPLKQLKIDEDGNLAFADKEGGKIIARQQLTPTYFRNGACYAISRQAILNEGTIMPKRTAAVEIGEVMVSIDTLDDFALVEKCLLERQKASEE